MKPQIAIAGNLANDPELRRSQHGKPWLSFRLAATPRQRDAATGEWVDGETLWLNCTLFGQGAENAANSLTKGSQVVVIGRLSQRTYTDNQGQQRVSLDVTVDEIGASLKFATAQITRPNNGGGYGNQPAGGGTWGQQSTAAQPAWGQPAGTPATPTQPAQPPQQTTAANAWGAPPQQPQQDVDTTAF